MNKIVLDACCGSRMFWFDRNNIETLYQDNRQLNVNLCDGRVLNVNPNVIADFRKMPYQDGAFSLVVFDPPHLRRAGDNSFMALKYGVLGNDWKRDIADGFSECWRVLTVNGTLVFKWNEDQISLREVLSVIKQKPLFGNRRSKTHWLVFYKSRTSAGNRLT